MTERGGLQAFHPSMHYLLYNGDRFEGVSPWRLFRVFECFESHRSYDRKGPAGGDAGLRG